MIELYNFFLINNQIRAWGERDSNRAVRTISQMYTRWGLARRRLLIWFRSFYSIETAFYQCRTPSHPLTHSASRRCATSAPPFDTPKYIKWTLKKRGYEAWLRLRLVANHALWIKKAPPSTTSLYFLRRSSSGKQYLALPASAIIKSSSEFADGSQRESERLLC